MNRLITLLVLALTILKTHAQNVYNCAAGSDCYIDCSNQSLPFTCNGGRVIGGNANKVQVDCMETDICDGLIVDCPDDPVDPNNSECHLYCHANNACNNFEFRTQAAASSTVHCGNILGEDQAITDIVCTNGLINGTFDDADVLPSNQYIGLECVSQISSPTASCADMTFANIGSLVAQNMTVSDEITVNLKCLRMMEPIVESAPSCVNITVDGGNLTRFELESTGGVKTCDIDISSPTLDQVVIDIMTAIGSVEDATIYANNSLSIILTVEGTIASLINSKVFGAQNMGEFIISAGLDSYIDNLEAHGSFNIMANGSITNSLFNGEMSDEFTFTSNGATDTTQFILTTTEDVHFFFVDVNANFEENMIMASNVGAFLFNSNGKVETNNFDLRNANETIIIIGSESGSMINNFINAYQSSLFWVNLYENATFNNGQDNIVNVSNAGNVIIDSYGSIINMALLATNVNTLTIINNDDATFINSEVKAQNASEITFISNAEVRTENSFFEVTNANTTQFQFWGTTDTVDIYAEYAGSLDVVCRSFNPNRVCNDLALYGPSGIYFADGPIRPNTRLTCVAFGCQTLVLNFPNGFSDIELVTGDCPCAYNESYINATDTDTDDDDFVECVDSWEITCGSGSNSSRSVFTNEFECELVEGSDNCCGDINDDASELQCGEDDDDDDEFWTDGAIIGFVVGGAVLLIIIFVGCLMFYRRKREAESNYGRLAENEQGYGATT